MIDPVAEYSHAEGGCSVTGGYVYRGSMPEWNGIYLYGDYCTGFVWGLIQVNGAWQAQVLFDTDVNITSFGQDEAGEVYLVADGGGVYQTRPQVIRSSLIHYRRIVISICDACHWQASFNCHTILLVHWRCHYGSEKVEDQQNPLLRACWS